MSKEISTKELSKILVKAIWDEPFLEKEKLVPKVKAIITAFRIKLAANNYNSIEKPSDKARLIRANELMNYEKQFWKSKLLERLSEDEIKAIYQEVEVKRLEWNGQI